MQIHKRHCGSSLQCRFDLRSYTQWATASLKEPLFLPLIGLLNQVHYIFEICKTLKIDFCFPVAPTPQSSDVTTNMSGVRDLMKWDIQRKTKTAFLDHNIDKVSVALIGNVQLFKFSPYIGAL